jgi:hypothetical protein
LMRVYNEVPEILDIQYTPPRNVLYVLKGTPYHFTPYYANDARLKFVHESHIGYKLFCLQDIFDTLPSELQVKIIYHLDLFA